MIWIQISKLGLISSFLIGFALSAAGTTPAQDELTPAPWIEGYTGYEHANCSGADGTVLGNLFTSPEGCASLCNQFGDECAGFVMAAGEAPGVKELTPGTLGNESWPWGSCYLRAGPAPMNVVDWPLDCMLKNEDGSYTKHEEQNCWGVASDLFRGTAFGGAPFGTKLTALADDDDDHEDRARERRRDREGRKERKKRKGRKGRGRDSRDDGDGDDEPVRPIVTPISYPWAVPTPEAESESLCQELCNTLGTQCTAVMRTPLDGQCYFRSSAGTQPLVDWAVRCYLKD